MKKRKKKRIEYNHNFRNIVFILLVILFIGGVFYYKNVIIDKKYDFNNNELNTSIDNNNNNTDKNNDSDNNSNTDSNKDDSYNDEYLLYKKQLGFNLKNLDRYISYHNNNSSLSYDKVVTYVNIGLDYKFYSYIKDADMSKGINILMNKYNKLSSDYEPDDLEEISQDYFINGNTYVRKLRKDAKEAFERLSKDSIEAGKPVYGQSAYREYSMQENLYKSAVNSMGVDAADNDTARPGHSEHQTGLAIDVSSNKTGNMLNFEKSDSFLWMQENAYKYGFILRYTKGNENIHGFIYEPWHYRYVGIEIATDMHNNYPELTYEEYYYKFID